MNRSDVEQLIQHQADAWQRADFDAVGADFCEDGQLISPGGTWQGPAAIAAVAREWYTVCSGVQVDIKRILVDGNQGAVEWVWHETRRADNQVYTMKDGIIFELRDGKILYWREYFDPKAIKQ
ncbi:MAG: nuclear transport factor 2 family protein [Caldilineaceae bacterium]|nr:nuclear transport factor 2 family protein [Caldilineaceae bacterium]MCB0081627.1 nuclear transport factor 2 family protein [Caldilineaceae bacterium]